MLSLSESDLPGKQFEKHFPPLLCSENCIILASIILPCHIPGTKHLHPSNKTLAHPS